MAKKKSFMKSGVVFYIFICLICPSFLSARNNQSGNLSKEPCLVNYLRCEYKVDPLGIDQTKPRLSWIVTSSQRGQKQTAYQVLVASSQEKLDANNGDLWDTKKVSSDETACVVYEGKRVPSQMECFWKVRIWDKDGRASDWSASASWSMGLLNKSDWKAQWIGLDNRPESVYEEHIDKQPYTFLDCNWVYCPAAQPSQKAFAKKYFFRKAIQIDPLARPKNLRLRLAVDGKATVFVNNEKFAEFQGYLPVRSFNLIEKLVDGNNIIAIRVESLPGSSNPPALIGKIIFEFLNEPSVAFPIDTDWIEKAGKLVPYGQAPWGRFEKTRLTFPPPAYLRKDFQLTKPVKRAVIYASALGLYQLYLNGNTVGQDYLTPGWTDYNKRVYYRSYDVTQMLHEGQNAVG